ncbi:MAG: hypothetical protein E7218_05005 [Anaerofustis stercorihominis]|nr:hypothetical protein [Anaerofustis stercorihominis]
MRKKIFDVLNTIYGVLMTVSFFGGILPLFPFIFALIIGGPVAESISVFIYEKYYPWIIITGSVAILSGLIAMYVGKLEGLSIKSVNTNKSSDKN